MGKDVDPVCALEAEFVQVICEKTGLKPAFAQSIVGPLVRHLQRRYGGERLYIPSSSRGYTQEEVRDFFQQAARDVDKTCERFSISRATLYRVLGGEDEAAA